MESGDSPAGDRNEAEGENLSGEDGTRPIDEARQRRELQVRAQQDDAHGQQNNYPQLHERAQVVARGQQEPYGQGARQAGLRDVARRPRSGTGDNADRRRERSGPCPRRSDRGADAPVRGSGRRIFRRAVSGRPNRCFRPPSRGAGHSGSSRTRTSTKHSGGPAEIGRWPPNVWASPASSCGKGRRNRPVLEDEARLK